MLTRQLGWQLPLCNMLNGSGGPDRTSYALCLQLLSEHIVSALTTDDGGWHEVVRTVTYIEMYTVEPVKTKRALFSSALDLLRGAVTLPSQRDSAEARAATSRVWAQLIHFCLMVEDSFVKIDEPAVSFQISGRSRLAQRSRSGVQRSSALSTSSTKSPVLNSTPATRSPSNVRALPSI